MGIINILPVEVSNKIAAGEVVERPASVIKELVENSVDSGATAVTIEVKKGGSTYMRVSDDGCGMSPEDAALCFVRHATSKITSAEDLDAIYTLGFRGEALASIGAVSQVSLYTKREDDEGVCVTCRGGEIISEADAGIPNGTTVIVENLFYNTPARAKFLKKDQTEVGYITDIVTRCVFAHPEISFRLIANGKQTIFSPGDNNLVNCIYTVYGRDYAKAALDVKYEDSGVKVFGVIGKGSASRPNRTYQSFFVNKRYIKSAMLTKALEEAYKNQIMIGKYPMAVLNIEINPELTDINVHPTKLEVKFSEEKQIYRSVYYAVKNTLYAITDVPQIERGETELSRVGAQNAREASKTTGENVFEKNRITAKTPIFEELAQNKNMFKSAENLRFERAGNSISSYGKESIRSFDAGSGKNYGTSGKAAASMPLAARTENQTKTITEQLAGVARSEDARKANEAFAVSEIEPDIRVIGQLFDSYIVAERGDEMLLFDQHAAHERLEYEELLVCMKNNRVMSQILIEPVVVNLTSTEMAAYVENRDDINALGFDSEEFGENAVIVRSAPGDVEPGEIEALLEELVTQSAQLKKELITEKNERLTYTIACKAAIKANRKLSREEAQILVERVIALKNINTCPHGRPIMIRMTKKEIEKEFKRIV